MPENIPADQTAPGNLPFLMGQLIERIDGLREDSRQTRLVLDKQGVRQDALEGDHAATKGRVAGLERWRDEHTQEHAQVATALAEARKYRLSLRQGLSLAFGGAVAVSSVSYLFSLLPHH